MSLDVALRHQQGAFSLDVAFAVDEPGVTALFGPSGAGKSTVVQAIAGLVQPDRGRVVIDGDVVFDREQRLHVPPTRRGIGCVFQDGRLFPHLTVEANLRFGLRRRGPGATRFADVVDLLGLGGLLARRPKALSGGERQRVALGRALLAAPRLLLLDEPLSALDAARKAEILPFLARIRDEARVPMVLVTHSVDEIVRLADTMVLMDRGRVAATAPVVEAMARLDLLSLTGEADAGAVIACRITGHDDGDALTSLAFDGGTIWVPSLSGAIGTNVRVRIRARDVLLATDHGLETSANTVLDAEVLEIAQGSAGVVDLKLAVGKALLVARLTGRSVRRLGLRPGKRVAALIKSVSIEARG